MRQLSKLLVILFISIPVFGNGQDCIPAKPNPPRLVNDFADVLSQNIEDQLEALLVGFNDTTSTQIAIVTVTDLCDYEPAVFAYEVGESWKVGDAKFNNGIVILVKPKYENSRGQAFIATGYGIEGVLPDAIAKRIVENEMIPAFKQNNYEKGIVQAAVVAMEITGGEYSAENYNGGGKRKKKTRVFPFFIVLFFIFFMLMGVFRRARRYGRSNNLGLWTALWLMGSMSGRHRGHYNNFTSGGGGFGGFGGGGSGFGGFGGGSFGGGGAGGSW